MSRVAGPMFGIYVGLALAGAVLPYVFFIPWVAEHGWAPGLFLRQLFATEPATIFAADVLWAAGVFILFAIVEGRRLGMRGLWLAPLLVVTVGLCCALPTFLAQRERALSKGNRP